MTWLTQLLTAAAKPFKWWVVVAPWERGVLVRLGRTAVLLHPGPHLRIPFVDRVYVQSVRLRTICQTNQTVGTKDGHVVVLSIALRFVIADILKLYDSVANPEIALETLIQSAAARIVAGTERSALTAERLERELNVQFTEPLTWGLGELQVLVTGFAYVKTYRLISNDYRTGAGLYHLDEKEGSGER